MDQKQFIPYTAYIEYDKEKMRKRAQSFYDDMKRRRTVRDFADRPVPRGIIEDCIKAAGTAPNGANKQLWHFTVVNDPKVKKEIREAAEEEEQEFYEQRATEEWLEALAPLGTDANKPFLKKAPYLIAVFAKSYSLDEQDKKETHYYVKESVGIATGMLITAIHKAGLVSLTHTPSPMGFLNDILNRPDNERPFFITYSRLSCRGCAST